jgi:protein SCO1/2
VARVLAVFVLTACGDAAPEPLMGMVRTPLANVGHVTLPAVSEGGSQFVTRAEPDKVLIVYFGYTACPDICPTTMADLRGAVNEMASDADRVDVALITVGPDRDTPEVLTKYIHVFFDDGIAFRTDDGDVLA